jgi:DNA replication and repair protein RecF
MFIAKLSFAGPRCILTIYASGPAAAITGRVSAALAEMTDSSHADVKPPRRTFVSALKLSNFRNYAALALSLDERVVVLTGPNGAGKTNLLEAVSFLSPGRGLRRAALTEVARHGSDGAWAVAARIVNGAGSVEIGTGVTLTADGPESVRRIRVNHAPARASDALLEHIRVLWLTPSMDGLFTGPASERRRFLDRAVLAIDRQHGTRFNAFEKAMRGRNRLLSEPAPDKAWLAAIEAEMAELGVAIAAARREWTSLASALIEAGGTGAAFPAAEIALEGALEGDLDVHSAREVEDRYRTLLGTERSRDAAAGRTLFGPHLSDLLVRHGPKQMPAESCSTGEQKALLIGLVLAQARLVARLTGETPVILLDEIAAHLDEMRRSALFAVLDELACQAFLTGTDTTVFAPLGAKAQRLALSDGHVTREDARP